MFYHYKIEKQLQQILKKFNRDEVVAKKSNESSIMTDIFDGKLYKKFENSDDYNKKDCLTFILNTDGISRCSKSKQTIYPIFLAINELPINSRFCIDNTIVAGTYMF